MTLTQQPVTLISNGHPIHEISIKSLVGYLEAKGVPCRTIYLATAPKLSEEQVQEVVKLCEGSALVGFSLMSKDVQVLRPLAAAVRKRGMPVVWGGIHATATAEESLRECDFVCVGEGELTLHRLYEQLQAGGGDYSQIPNLAYVAEGQAVLPKTFHSEASLDALPYPDYEFKDAYMHQGDGQLRRIPPHRGGTAEVFWLVGVAFLQPAGVPVFVHVLFQFPVSRDLEEDGGAVVSHAFAGAV